MKKIGIITMYNGSNNYGGVLQSYALQKEISKLGYDCDQISFSRKSNKNFLDKFKNRCEVNNVFFALEWAFHRTSKLVISKIAKSIYKKKYDIEIKERRERFNQYRNNISHSAVYTSENIDNCGNLYDVFVCGSDQIWKPGVVCREYLLKFVPDNIHKFSYAASISKNMLSNDESNYLVKGIERLNAISVREQQAKELLKKYTDKKVEWVVDPTLLLCKDEWEKECSNLDINYEYIFCYLLGFDKKQRKIIEKLAKSKKMKIVTIPFADGRYNFMDRNFGDIHYCNAGPNEFLALIKNAKLVITDSFHATVFSNIFETDFYVLERTEEKSMNTRITSLLDMVGLSDRFIQNFEDILTYIPIDFIKRKKYDSFIVESKKFLKNNLEYNQ